MDAAGGLVHKGDAPLALRISFEEQDLHGMLPETIGIYTFDESTEQWMPLPMEMEWGAMQATALTQQVAAFALIGKLPAVISLPLVVR